MDQPYRTRKLDLVLHLVANLNTTVVLKAASRPDSTDLLRHLQAHALPNWAPCYIKATPNLDFAGVTEELLKVLRKPATGAKDELHALLEEQLVILERQHKCLVLLLDHAGVLMPGMLAAICQYARLNPPLKIVCALKPDEVATKTTTDALALVDAQIVPIAQDQAAAMAPAEEAPAVVVRPIAVPKPKKIVREPPPPKPVNLRLIGGVAGLVLAVAAAATWRLWAPVARFSPITPNQEAGPTPPAPAAVEPPPPPETPASPPATAPEPVIEEHQPEPLPAPAVETKPTPALATQTQPESPKEAAAPAPPAVPNQTALEPKPAEPLPMAPAPVENPKAGTLSPALPPAEKAAEATGPATPAQPPKPPEPAPAAKQKPNAMGDVHNAEWLMQQSGKAFTLQLVTVSQLGNVPGLIRRLPPSDQLSMYKTNRGAGDLYFILYGIYPNLAAATAAASELAGANGGRPVPRPIKSIQDDIRKYQSRAAPQPPTDPLTQP